jgi:predicted Zn-dependent peptidase
MEREVVLEEIATVEDTPDDLAFDLHAELMWQGHPYGYRILGTRHTVAALGVAELRQVHATRYTAGNLIVAGAGNIDHDTFVARVAAGFCPDVLSAGPGPARSAASAYGGAYAGVASAASAYRDRGAYAGVANGAGAAPPVPGSALPCRRCVERPTAQTHLVWGRTTFGHGDPRRSALVLLSSAFGGGTSSRLFQRVREELGLAYSVFSFQSFYAGAGVSGVYVGTRPESADRAEAVIAAELQRLARDGITAGELEDVKGQVKGQVALSLESSSARLHRLAGTELYHEPFRNLDEITALVEAVTLDDVAELAAEYFAPDRQTLLRLGPANRTL